MFPSCLIKLQDDVDTLQSSIASVNATVSTHKTDTTAHPDISVANSTKWNSSAKIVSSTTPVTTIGEVGDIYFQTI